MNNNAILNHVKGKTILITGGTGSIGSSIVKKILNFSPHVVRILDNNENQLFFQRQSLKNHDNVRYFVGDIRNKERLLRAIDGVDIIFHTAALKHVTLCEENPFEAATTNVIGTQNVIDIALEKNVSQLIHISTDKVVNAINTLGASKLLSEKLIMAAQHYVGHKNTLFCGVRFGNVMGTRGSLMHIIAEQLRNNVRPTITHNKMTRFLMTEDQASDFILNVCALNVGGKIFVPKMPAVKILDLISAIIDELSPHDSHSQSSFEETGIRMGEKLYEELMTEFEFERCVEMNDMYVIPDNLSTAKIIPKTKIHLNSDNAEKLPYSEVRKIVADVISNNSQYLLDVKQKTY